MDFSHPRLQDLEQLSKTMSFEQAKFELATLLRDNRVACLFRIGDQLANEAADLSSSPQMASKHGDLAHAGGYRYGVQAFLRTFAEALSDQERAANDAKPVG